VMEAETPVREGMLRVEYHQWWSAEQVLPW
jgi:hypothetical protein